jgi:aryl-alcohol dehydrogenase-like predicted oxidoreductase
MTEFPQRQIGRTGLRVTELGLGCATLGGSQIAVARATA